MGGDDMGVSARIPFGEMHGRDAHATYSTRSRSRTPMR